MRQVTVTALYLQEKNTPDLFSGHERDIFYFRTKEDVVVLLKPSMKSIENGLRNTSNSGRQMV